jgi:hypothetical protein
MPKGIRGLIHMKHISRFILPALLVLLLVKPLSASGPGEAKRVLILYSEDKNHPSHEMTEQGIREAFRSNKLFDVQLLRFLSGPWKRAPLVFCRSRSAKNPCWN